MTAEQINAINRIKEGVSNCKEFNQDMDAHSWGYEEGVLISANQAIAILELIGQQRTEIDERIKYYEDKIEMLIRTSAENEAHARTEGIREGFEAAREIDPLSKLQHFLVYPTADDYLNSK